MVAQLGHEEIWPSNFDCCRDTPIDPVMNALDPTLFQLQKACNSGGTAKASDKVCIAHTQQYKHHVYFNVNAA